jgi:hypothetical protein
VAQWYTNETNQQIISLPERVNDLFIFLSAVNVREFMHKEQDLPLQFVYDAVNCRLYYTKDTTFNQTALCMSATEAIKSLERLCVPGSTTKGPPTPVDVTMSLNITTSTINPDLEKQLEDKV